MKRGKPGRGGARCIARIQHEARTRWGCMRRGCSQAGERRISIPLGDLCMALSITTTSFLCLSTSAVAFPSTNTLFSFRSYKQASPLCQTLGYISLPETVTAPSCPHMNRCEKHAVLPPPHPFLCISHPLPVYCALCSVFSSLVLNPFPTSICSRRRYR